MTYIWILALIFRKLLQSPNDKAELDRFTF